MTWGRILVGSATLLLFLHGNPVHAQQPQPQPGQDEDPLEKILELMKSVQERLYDADTGENTQVEQKKIVEAMRFETKTSQALEKLIYDIENRPP